MANGPSVDLVNFYPQIRYSLHAAQDAIRPSQWPRGWFPCLPLTQGYQYLLCKHPTYKLGPVQKCVASCMQILLPLPRKTSGTSYENASEFMRADKIHNSR